MSLKVGQAQQVGAAAASRAAAAHHAVPAGARQVDGLWASNRAGAEEESLRFTDTWDDLQQGRPRRRVRLGLHPEAVRFGSILASEDIGALMLAFRTHELPFMPSLRTGAMLYEQAKTAIGTGGHMRVIGGQLNRIL